MRQQVIRSHSILIIMTILSVGLLAQPVDNLEQGIKLFEAQNYQEARRYFLAQQESTPGNHQTLYYLGRIDYHEGQLDEAIRRFKQTVEIERKNSVYHLWLGRAYLQKLQKANFFQKGVLAGRVKDNFRKAVKYDSSNVAARVHLANYYLQAPAIAGGSKKKALAQAEEIIAYDARQGRLLLAQIYAGQQKYDLALQEYRELVDLYPQDEGVYYHKGMFHQQAGQFDAAFAAFEKTLEINPLAGQALYQIGRTAVFSGRNLERAIECMNIYLQHEPQQGQPALDSAHWRLGMLYEKAGDLELAKQEYEKALMLNPQEEKYEEALKNLQSS